jgi:zinc transport system substrate-binding protein
MRNILLLALILAIFSCTTKKQISNNITVSILPQKYMVEKICGEGYNINVLIPPGSNPATCEMTTNQVTDLLKSSIYFSIGYLPYETTHIKNLLEKHKELNHINLSDNIELIHGLVKHGDHFHEGGVDPHVWTSCNNVKIMSKDILKGLINTYPDKKEVFTNNYNDFIKEIDSIYSNAKSTLQNLENKNFIIYHPALTYFAKEHGLKQIPVEYEGKSPSPVHLKDIIETARNTKTTLVLVQKQFDSKKAEFIAKEIDGKVIEIDPLNPDWYGEMNRLIKVFSDNLK